MPAQHPQHAAAAIHRQPAHVCEWCLNEHPALEADLAWGCWPLKELTSSGACLQVLLDKSEMDMEIAQLQDDIKNIEGTLESMVVGRFAGGYRVGQQGDPLCVIRSRSRLTL